jgi:hypothetical protein
MYLLPGTGAQRAGKTSRIIAQGVPLTYASWNVDQKAEDLDTMNFESYNVVSGESYGEGIHDGLECGIRGGGDWDAAAAPYGNPPGLYVRDDLSALYFYTSRIDNVFWLFPWARIRSATNGAQVKQKVTFEFSGMSQGTFIVPTVSV